MAALVCLLGIVPAGACSGKVETGAGQVVTSAAGNDGSSGPGGAPSRGGSGGSLSAGTGGAPGAGGVDPLDCRPVLGEHGCLECARRNCCVELLTCGKDPLCMGAGEFACISRCAFAAAPDGGKSLDAIVSSCATDCASGATIAPATKALITCLQHEPPDAGTKGDCRVECFTP